MSLIKCRECGKEISSEASTCPNCGAPPPPGKSFGKAGCLITGVAALVLLFALNPTGSGSIRKADTATAACLSAQDFVTERLKSPSTADFAESNCFVDAGATKTPTGSWIVRGVVDSQNGFGAKVRTGYRAEVQYNSDFKSWAAIAVDVAQRR